MIAVSHSATQQLAANTGLLPRRVEIPHWVHDGLATYFQDYDWADEVLHAQIGRRWLKPDVGDVKTLLEQAGLQVFDSGVRQPDAVFVARLASSAPDGPPPKPLYLRAPDAKLPGLAI